MLAPYNSSRYSDLLFSEFGIPFPLDLLDAVQKRKAEFLAGRALVQRAFDDIEMARYSVPIGPSRAPIWPSTVIGSISHTDSLCACILSNDTNLKLGVDVENIIKDEALEAISRFVLKEHEVIRVKEHTMFAAGVLETTVFSAKETLFKALYPTVQMFFGFDCAEFLGIKSGSKIRFRLTKALHPSLASGRTFDVNFNLHQDYVLTWIIN